jgi:hypothetical protein
MFPFLNALIFRAIRSLWSFQLIDMWFHWSWIVNKRKNQFH